jgi:hypothetical protein
MSVELRRRLRGAGAAALAVVLLIWWLLPVYNMILIALHPEGTTEFTGDLWPTAPTLEAFRGVLFQRYWYLQDFWRQLGNSFFIGVMTLVLTRPDQLAGQLRAGPDVAGKERGDLNRCAAHLHDPGVLPRDPVLSAHAQL